MTDIKQAVILAGGRGTRLRPFTEQHPKPLYPVGGRPFLDHLLSQLRAWGIERVLLLLGYKAEQVVEHVLRNPVEGLIISFDIAPVEYETAGRLAHARHLLDPAFLLTYCDNYCPLDYAVHKMAFLGGKELVRICAYANADGYTKSNLRADADGRVLVYDKARCADGLSGVDIGYALVRRKVLDMLPPTSDAVNFEATAYPKLVESGRLYATFTEHRYYSVGDWGRMPLTERFFSNPPTVFLDRDGTLNVRPLKACYVETPDQFQWLPGAREAVAALKRHGWRVLLFTNQPGVARGVLSEDALAAIHARMQDDLCEVGGEVDSIYACLHGWDDGCECRKPKPGLLFKAQKDHCLDLTTCVVIGDDPRDVEAGRRAGCRCVLVDADNPLPAVVSRLLEEALV